MESMELPQVDYLLIDLIASCNLNCLHCRASDFDKKQKLPLDIFKNILSDAKEMGIKTITFSGGEPFLREDIFDLIKMVKDFGFVQRIQSNILLLEEKKIKQLKDFGVDYVGTGIDGLRESHEKLRNSRGSFDKVLENIKILKKYGIKVHVEFTATNFNYLDFKHVMELCESLGVYDVMTRAVLPTGKGKKFDFSLSLNQYRDFLNNVKSIKNENIDVKLYCQDPISIYLDEERINEIKEKYSGKKILGGCSSGLNMIYISPEGIVKPCSFLDYSFGSLKDSSLKDILNSDKRRFFVDKQFARNFGTMCSSCDIKFLCGGCRARALNFNEDMWGDDPFCFKNLNN